MNGSGRDEFERASDWVTKYRLQNANECVQHDN